MVRKQINLILLLGAILLVALLASGCNSSETGKTELGLVVTSPKDKAELRINVVEIIGTVSDPGATVTVNSQEARIENDGSFHTFLDLQPGNNTIETIATNNQETTTDIIDVEYIPALAVDLQAEDIVIQGSQALVEVKGYVTIPQAQVTINGSPVTVNEDGDFSDSIKALLTGDSTYLYTVAEWGSEKDREYTHIAGLMVPGMGIQHVPMIECPETISIKAGDIKSVNVVLNTGRLNDSNYPCDFSYDVYMLGTENGKCDKFPRPESCKLPLLNGLEVYVEPHEFTAYANTSYTSSLTVATSEGLVAGHYTIALYYAGSYIGENDISIEVE